LSTVLNIAGVDNDLLGKHSWRRQRPPWHIPLVQCVHVQCWFLFLYLSLYHNEPLIQNSFRASHPEKGRINECWVLWIWW
jgi:hypothetical protein